MQSGHSHTSPDMPLFGIKISRTRSVLAVIALSLGCFTFVSTELMPIGILPNMANGLQVSLGSVGYLVTLFAFMVVLTATPATALLGNINRKALMAGLLAACFIGNLVTWLSADYWLVLLGRFIVAIAIGVFWSTAVVTAVYLVSAKNAVRATSLVFGGVSLATVLGVPMGTLLGDLYGWRAVFAVLSLLSLISFTLITWAIPAIHISQSARRGVLSRVLKNRALIRVFIITAFVVTGNFLAYTYISPFLSQVAGQSSARVGLLLLVYGGAGMIANFGIGPFAAKTPHLSLVAVVVLLSLSLLSLNLSASYPDTLILSIALWGAAYGALPVLLQTLVFNTASRWEGGADAATSINVSVFNAAIGLGALLGGMLVNAIGAYPVPYLAGAFALTGLLVMLFGQKSHRE